jgi:hypothetical protein
MLGLLQKHSFLIHFFSLMDGFAGDVDDMKATLRVLLQEVRTLKPPMTPHESSEVGNTGLEESHPPAVAPSAIAPAVVDPVWPKEVHLTNEEVPHAS